MITYYHAEFGPSGQTARAYFGDTPETLGLSCPAFQGYTRSSEPTQIDQQPMTSYLVVRSSCVPSPR